MSFLRPPRFLVGIFFISVVVFTPLSAVFADGNTITTAQVQQSLDYIWTNQDPTTGGLSEQSTGSLAAWVAIAFVSAGYNPESVKQDTASPSLLDYIRNNACASSTLTDIEMTVIALSASRIPLTDITNCDLNQKLESAEFSGEMKSSVANSVFGILAYKSYKHSISNGLITYIKNQQEDGSWGFYYADDYTDPSAIATYHADNGTTAQAIMALKAGGVSNSDGVIATSLTYLKSKQGNDGGIWYDPANPSSDTFSDSYALQALYSTGEDPYNTNWSQNNKNIFNDIARYRETNGAYQFASWGESNPVWTTATVLPALLGYPLPVLPTVTLLSFTPPQENTRSPVDNTDGNEASSETNDNSGVNSSTTTENKDTSESTTSTTVKNNPVAGETSEISSPQSTLIQTATKASIRTLPPKTAFQDLSKEPGGTISSTIEPDSDSNKNIKAKDTPGKVLGSEDNKNRQNSSNNNWIYTLIGLSGALIGFFLYRLSISK